MNDIYAAEEKAIKDTLQKFSPEFVEALEYFGNQLWEEFSTNVSEKKKGELVRRCRLLA